MAARGRSGFLFMLIIFALLGIIIYTYKDRFSVLFNTGYSTGKDFVEKNFGKKDKDGDKMITEKIDLLDKKNRDVAKEKIKKNLEGIKDNIDYIKKNVIKHEVAKKDNKEIKQETNNQEDNIIKKSKQDSKEKEDKKRHYRKSRLYFSVIQNDDKLKLVSVNRSISYIDTPLTETLKSLLAGPNSNEKSSKFITNIPNNTQLLSVSIKNNIAYINLSKEFEFNSYGKESTIAQIKQIIYTATEFSNVKSVKFLINGQAKTYLGGEGILINKPLARSDFSWHEFFKMIDILF